MARRSTAQLVEVEPTGLRWYKSSASGGGNCVEIAFDGDRVLVRDSRRRSGPSLHLPLPAWQAFLHRLRG